MSEVVGINGKDVAHRTLAEKATDAKEALRQLLSAIELGELEVENWLLIYDSQSRTKPGYLSTASLDSGLSVAEAHYLAQNFLFYQMLAVRGM